MGRGQRHSKNAGVMGSEGLSYHEKKALGFGTVRERVGKEALGNFDDCCLTLQPAVDPVCTPQGYVYSKEAILENLVQQKKLLKKRLALWETQQKDEQMKASEMAAAEAEAKLLAFDRQNHMGASDTFASNIEKAIKEEAEALLADKKVVNSVLNIKENESKIKEMRAFWLPSKTPESRHLVNKPDLSTACPASGKKLRLKDLIPLKFTKVPEGESGRYMDPITKDTFTNKSKLVVLKATGDVLLKDTYTNFVKADGSYNGVRIKDSEVIELQRGGTGFVAHDGKKVEVNKFYDLGPGNGLADLRGQHQGPRSASGLQFWN